MSKYVATIIWERDGVKFTDNKYKRSHHWEFDGGQIIPASSSPKVVPTPFSDPSGVDPEEAFIASLSSCHMLWFLSIAAEEGFVVEHYNDEAEGLMENNEEDQLAITEVMLRPHVTYVNGSAPSIEENAEMHLKAHEKCFIANSVRTKINVDPSMRTTETI